MSTLDQVFRRESAWIAVCGDVDALMDKIQDWGDSIRAAEREGDMLVRMRAGDLVELARKRVVHLTASAIRAEAARTAPPKPAAPKIVERRVEPRVAEPVRAPEPKESQPAAAPGRAWRDAEAEAASAAAAKAKADARLAAAEADKIELQNTLLRAQVEAAQRPAAAPVAAPAPKAPAPVKGMALKAPRTASMAPSKPVAPAGGPTTKITTAAHAPAPARRTPPNKQRAVPLSDHDGYSEADRLALASVGHWPPTPPGHRGAFWSKHDDWPRDWTLTGGDLGRFRGEINLTRAVFAAQLGVPSALIKDAELAPRERIGPALQVALRRAMDHEALARRARREARAAAQVPAEPAAPSVPTVPPVVVVPTANVTSRTFTGADLAGLRAERRLSQREMADLLGVEQGTISKGEGKADAALGPTLQEALARLAAGGATAIPE